MSQRHHKHHELEEAPVVVAPGGFLYEPSQVVLIDKVAIDGPNVRYDVTIDPIAPPGPARKAVRFNIDLDYASEHCIAQIGAATGS